MPQVGKKMRINLLILLVLLSGTSARAGYFAMRTFEEGAFPKVGEAYGMLQDRRGVIWAWGSNGITSYDGHRFQHFNKDHGLPADYCYTLREHSDGLLYASTYGGLVSINPASGEIKQVLKLYRSPVRDVAFHPWGLFLAAAAGVVFFRDGRKHLLSIPDEGDHTNKLYMAHRLEIDEENGILWVATDREGIARFEIDKLLPLFDLKENVRIRTNNDSILCCPTVFRGPPNEAMYLDSYLLSDSAARRAIWLDAVKNYKPDPEESWPCGDLDLSPSTSQPFVHDNANIYTVNTRGKLEKVMEFEQEAPIRSIAFHGDTLSVCRSDGLYFHYQDTTKHLDEARGLAVTNLLIHLQDRQGLHWLIDSQGVLHRVLDEHVRVFTRSKYPQLKDMKQAELMEDGSLMLASSRGLSRLSGKTLESVVGFDELVGGFLGFAVDKRGNTLVATDTRLYLYDHRSRSFILLLASEDPNVGRLRFVSDPATGNILFTLFRKLLSWDGQGLNRIGGKEHWNPLNVDVHPTGRIYVCHWPMLIEIGEDYERYYAESYILQKEIIPAKAGQDTVERYCALPETLSLGSFSPLVSSVGPDSAYWVGTFSSGLMRLEYDGDVRRAARKIRFFDTRTGLPTNKVLAMKRDAEGKLYFTLRKSAVIVHRDSLEVVQPTLPESATLSAYERDSQGHHISATSHGLFIQDETGHYGFNRTFGLPENSVSGFLLLPDQRLLALQPNGFFLMDVDGVLESVRRGAAPIISRLSVGEERRSTSKPVEIRTSRRAFSASIALPDYFNEELHTFSWKLEGFDNDFRPYSDQTHIEYTNLPPGEYRLQIRARNGVGMTAFAAESVSILVPPRFYETTWFAATAALAIVLLGYGIYIWRLRRFKEKQAHLLKLEKEKLEMVNTIAATVAHEFNNPLAIIKGSYDIIQLETADESVRKKHLQRIPIQVERMRQLIQKLLQIRELNEKNYASGMKILDIYNVDDDISEESKTGSEQTS